MVTRIEELVKQAEALPERDLAALINDLWDLQIARDSKAGRLDHLIEEASAEHKAGKTRPL